MQIFGKALIAVTMLGVAAPSLAHEVIVTVGRRGYNNGDASYSDGLVATSRPIINLKRTADYAVQTVRVAGDARDTTQRRNDLTATIRAMIAARARRGSSWRRAITCSSRCRSPGPRRCRSAATAGRIPTRRRSSPRSA